MKKQTTHQSADDLRGVSQLAIDATTGVTDLVEAVHRNITHMRGITASTENGRTSGLTGVIYHGVRSLTQIVGEGIDKGEVDFAAEVAAQLAASKQ